MAEPGYETGFVDTGLFRIDFPGVEIKQKLMSGLVDTSQTPPRQRVWKQAKVASARDRQLDGPRAKDGNGKFDQRVTRGGTQTVWIRLRVRNPIAVMPHGENARIVPEPLF